jgi:hypothetical protein
VAAKVVEGEAIIINLSNGIYYSMENVGAFIWEYMAAGLSLGEIVTTVTTQYEVSAEHAQADLEQLAAQLVEEGIVQPTDDDPSPLDRPGADGRTRLPYDPPRLEIFRDIGHLLALDPPMPGLRDVPWNASAQDAPSDPPT